MMDSPTVQEEATDTYEDSRDSSNLEKYMCIILVEWGESVLSQVNLFLRLP